MVRVDTDHSDSSTIPDVAKKASNGEVNEHIYVLKIQRAHQINRPSPFRASHPAVVNSCSKLVMPSICSAIL